ncbi:LysR family transcriptional regulator [Roseobacter sp.]|uniref:LysR family transcriptional regulator n=1 Tax=Roseobacter sp. TaxID=1907202 RepID=UPI003299D2F3
MNWTNIPSLSALRAFEAAARLQNLSAAARELNVTHAAIAQHVRTLEHAFSESLLIRQGRGVAPTPAGQQLAARLKSGFEIIADAVQDLHDNTADRPLNITVTPGFATSWLMPRIGEFWAQHPQVQLNITPSTALIDLRRDGFDLAVRYGEGVWPKLTSELLTAAQYWAVAHPDLVAGRTVRSLHDLSDLPWLLDVHQLERHRIIEAEGLDLSTLQVTQLNTNDLALSAATAGLGVTVQPRPLVERDINTGQLVKLLALREGGLGYHMVTVPGRTPPALKIFMRWLREKAASW